MSLQTSTTTTSSNAQPEIPAYPWSSPLSKIHSEMITRNKTSIMKSGEPKFTIDPLITSYPANSDPRRALALTAIPVMVWSAKGEEMLRELEDFFDLDGDVVLYTNDPGADVDDASDDGKGRLRKGKLHWTLMQLLGFNSYPPNPPLSSSDSKKYGEKVKDSLKVNEKFSITYTGVIAVGTGLVIVGMPSIDMNSARDDVRRDLSGSDYPFNEPFVNDICHSTVLRFSNGSGDGEIARKAMGIVEKYSAIDGGCFLGTGTIEKLSVKEVSWRMIDEELVKDQEGVVWELE